MFRHEKLQKLKEIKNLTAYKEVDMSRTFRRAYTKSKRFDRTCRNHGSCGYCRLGRTHNDRKRRAVADEELKEFKKKFINIENMNVDGMDEL